MTGITSIYNMDRFLTPAGRQRFEIEIKRSRFITTVVPAVSKTVALNAIKRVRNEFPDANHHCWAMLIGAPSNPVNQDQHDDGEPKGTAGKPMLNVLQHSEMGNLVVIVSRYFGGIKLGAGGLVRAYSSSVSAALLQMDTVIHYLTQQWRLELAYAQLDTLEHWLQSTSIKITDRAFTDSVTLQLDVPKNETQALIDHIQVIGGRIDALS